MTRKNIPVYADAILRTLKNSFPFLDLNYLTYFRPVFYPIAVIQAGLQQETFEDFTIVELNVLRLIADGYRETEQIADLMGLTPTYVAEVITMLQDYEHLDDALQLTPLGKRSLAEERNIRLITSKQLFEVDAVNGYPLQPDQTIALDGQKAADTLHDHDMVMLNTEEVSSGSLLSHFQKTFLKSNSQRFRQAVNINVRNILEPTLQEVKYGCGFLMLLENQAPLFFVKINTTLSHKRTLYRWQPLAVSDETSAALLRWDDPLFFTDRGRAILESTVRAVIQDAQSERTQEVFRQAYRTVPTEVLHLSEDGIEEVLPQVFCLRSDAFTRLNSETLSLLSELGSVNNVCVYLRPEWLGNVVKFVRDIRDTTLAYISQRLKYEIDQSDFNTVLARLSARIPIDQDCPLIDRILTAMNWSVPKT